MNSGEGAEGQEVPPMLVEVEVQTDGGHAQELPDAIKDATRRVRTSCSSGLLLPKRFPFRTAKGFGNWIHARLASSPEKYEFVYLRIVEYCSGLKIRELVNRGMKVFRGYDRLCFLQGIFIIAVFVTQKLYVRNVFAREFEKMRRRAAALKKNLY